jgi:hypothetical protein
VRFAGTSITGRATALTGATRDKTALRWNFVIDEIHAGAARGLGPSPTTAAVALPGGY